jgi:protein-tyrosine phosphatase
MPSILFVCNRNRYRSPLAAAIFWNRLCAWGRTEGWRVESAGIRTEPGLPVDALAQRAAREIGLDLRNHRTHSIDQICLDEYDLIVAMEKSDREALSAEFPEYEEKIHLLTYLAGEVEDLPDPSVEHFSFHLQMAGKLVKLINVAYARICELAVHRLAL